MAIQAGRHATGTVQRAPQTRKIPALELDPPDHRSGRIQQWWMAKRTIWLDALFVWLLTRAFFLGLTLLVPALSGAGGQLKNPLAALRAWYILDAAQLLSIAQHGYDQPLRAAYFPLFPLLVHPLAPLAGGDYGLAALVISNIAFFGVLVILRDLVERDFGADTAHRAILYLAIFPTAFYSFAPYSESLYLLLSLGAFAALRQRRWWLAGVLGGLAAFTHSFSILLLVPFAIEFVIARRYRLIRWWESLAALLIPAGIGVYAVYLQVRFHDPLAFAHTRVSLGDIPQSPGDALAASISALAAGGHQSVTLTHLALNLAAVVAFLALGVVVLWRLPLSYGLYTLALLLFYLLFPATYALEALPGPGRYVAVLFPVFIVLAQWGKRERMHETLVLAQVALLTVFAIHFFAAGSGGSIPLWW